MVFLFTNITSSTLESRVLRINDIPNRSHIVEVQPGETIDLEILSNRNQICQSHHIKTWVNQGFATTDTLGTEPDPNCRIYVNALISGITIDSVTITEPLLQSVLISGIEASVTGTQIGSIVAQDVQPILPNTPVIYDISLTANTEQGFTLPLNTRRFLIVADDSEVEFGFVAAGSKISIPCQDNFSEVDVDASEMDLFFQSNSATTIKVLAWSVV